MDETQKEVMKEEEAVNINKKLSELMDLSETEDLIKNNEKIFIEDGVTYRIKKPTYKERQVVYQKRIEKYTELLSNEKYLLEKDLKKLYLKRDIDIDAMTAEINNKIARRDELMIQLGELIKNGASDEDLQKYKTEIQGFNAEIQLISIRKTSLLEVAIESQVMVYVYSYLTFLIAEKKVGEEWVKVWKTFEEFQNTAGGLSNRLLYYTTLITSPDEI